MKKPLVFPEAMLGISILSLAAALIDAGVLFSTGEGILHGRGVNLAAIALGGALVIPLALRLLGLAFFVGEQEAGLRKVAADVLEPEPLSLPRPGEDAPMRPVPKDRPESAYKDLAIPSRREKRVYHAGIGLLTAAVVSLFAFNPSVWILAVLGAGVAGVLLSMAMFTVRLNRGR